MDSLEGDAQRHVKDILQHAFEYEALQSALVVYDDDCELSKILISAYRFNLPTGKFIDFKSVTAEQILAEFDLLKPSDLVVLIQSTSFRLDAFRIRIELFKRELKVIEHPHLARMNGHEVHHYIDSLAYDPQYFRGTGKALKERIDQAQSAFVDSGGEKLMFPSGFEIAKLNVGDYRDMKNWGGQFPIGEVFTEARVLEDVHGKVRIFAFGDTSFTVNRPQTPITLVIEKGRVKDVMDSTPEFDQVISSIRELEGEVWVRELGFGLNRAFSKDRVVRDIGTYERMCGIHLSLGAKHLVYKKPQFKDRIARHHVDVFAVTKAVFLDDQQVYQDGSWILEPVS